ISQSVLPKSKHPQAGPAPKGTPTRNPKSQRPPRVNAGEGVERHAISELRVGEYGGEPVVHQHEQDEPLERPAGRGGEAPYRQDAKEYIESRARPGVQVKVSTVGAGILVPH